MKFICLGYMDEKLWEGMTDTDRNSFMDECFEYDESLQARGHYAGGEALEDSANARTLRFRNGEPSITDGPFAETKEQLGGILILEARDLGEAVALMSKHPSIRMGTTFEVRPAADLSSFVNESRERRTVLRTNRTGEAHEVR